MMYAWELPMFSNYPRRPSADKKPSVLKRVRQMHAGWECATFVVNVSLVGRSERGDVSAHGIERGFCGNRTSLKASRSSKTTGESEVNEMVLSPRHNSREEKRHEENHSLE